MMSLLAQQQQQQQQQQSSTASPSGVADHRMIANAMSYHDKTAGCDLPAMPQTVKSQSIPISGMHRTASEVQLCEDEALADYRDYVVYSRIVQGITRQRETSHNLYLRQENDKCLAHIMSTRNNQASDPSLQSMSYHIAQRLVAAQHQQQQMGVSCGGGVADDYFCGEEPPESSSPYHQQAQEMLAEEDEGIFTLEL